MARKPPLPTNCRRARSTAVTPCWPVRRKIANNSASLSAPAPRASNFSRGRSSVGQSVMAMVIRPTPEAGCLTLKTSHPAYG